MTKSEIEFIEDGHIYLNSDGIIIPSVSELIRFKFPEQYQGVPDRILKKKANYGSKTHEYIERFVNKEFTIDELQKKRIDPDIKIAVEQFESLRKKWCFQIKDMERIVSWDDRYAGKFDLLTDDDYVIDIKTTTELHTEWLKWQLSLYALAMGINKDHHYCMWLPKGKMGKVVQVDALPLEDCKQLVKDYEEYSAGRQEMLDL